ncbi:ribonuclease HII [Fonsecaea monophora]|uniref:Ribonuclease HII n=1 Tax=Fonsecaea monophora TaxID=254056 RepID=A0A177F1H7_9EURO|nr:ribonuclease HII [Fonsecaea monophora]OAG38177.1 ribonuclease HII [Fonsecaea monophora]
MLKVLLFHSTLDLMLSWMYFGSEDDRSVEESDAVDEPEPNADLLSELVAAIVLLVVELPTATPEFDRVVCDWEVIRLIKDELLLGLDGELDNDVVIDPVSPEITVVDAVAETGADTELEPEVGMKPRGVEVEIVMNDVFAVSEASDAVALELCGAEAAELGPSDGAEAEFEDTELTNAEPDAAVIDDPCTVAG